MRFNKLYFNEYKDQFNYYNLIQKINPEYRLYFNNKDKKFAIVNINNNFEICKVFDSFFGNILHDLRFFKIENFNQIINFTENINNKIKQENDEKVSNITKFSLTEAIKLNNRSKEIKQTDINKIIGATKC